MKHLPCIALLSLTTAATACAPVPEDSIDSVASEMVLPIAGNDPVREGVVLVTRSTLRCTGAMLDAVTVLTGGACVSSRAADFRVQLGTEVQAVSAVRFTTAGAVLLELRRPFAALPSFTRRVSTRTAAQLGAHAMRCFGYATAPDGSLRLGLGSMTVRSTTATTVSLGPVDNFTRWESTDQGTFCMDNPSNSLDVDALAVSTPAGGNATALSAASLSTWVDFSRAVSFDQRALLFEAVGTGRCLTFDGATGRVATATCDQAAPRQGLYQQAGVNTTTRLRGADDAACMRVANGVLGFGACAAAPTSAESFVLRLNAAATAYRLVNGASCASVSGGAVSMRACNNADATQELAMRWSTY